MNPHEELTAQEKSARGLALSAADITVLMTDPNSWVYKLYVECQNEAALLREINFIRYVEACMRELELAKHHVGATEQATHVQQTAFKIEMAAIASQRGPLREELSPMMVNKVQLTSLLQLSQQAMTPQQLVVHNQQLTTLAQNQILAGMNNTFGPNMTVMFQSNNANAAARPVTINLPTQALTPSITVPELLRVNPTLSQEVSGGPRELQESFIVDFSDRQTYGPDSVIKRFRDILSENQQAFEPDEVEDIGLNQVMSLLRALDTEAALCRKLNKPLSDRLRENNSLLFANYLNQLKQRQVEQIFIGDEKVAYFPDKQPAFFAMNPMVAALKNGPKPVPGKTKTADDDWWKQQYIEESRAKNRK